MRCAVCPGSAQEAWSNFSTEPCVVEPVLVLVELNANGMTWHASGCMLWVRIHFVLVTHEALGKLE